MKATPPPAPPGRSLISARALMSIRNLELRARIVVEGFWSGIHRSPHHGFSVEFTEYRPYTAGDDLRYLDWRVFARSDRYFIRKFEEETNLRCLLVTDQSRSMTFGTVGHSKAEYAATLAATLAYFLHGQGDAVGLLSFDERLREYLPARHRAGHLRRLLLALEQPAGGTTTDLPGPLRRVVEIIRKRSLLVVISDFLAPLDRLEPALLTLTAAGHEVIVFQTLDPAEIEFTLPEAALFEDVETGRTLFVDPRVGRAEYRRKLEAHLSGLRQSCQRVGAAYHLLSTDRPLELALFDFLHERARRGTRLRNPNLSAGSAAR